MKKNVIDLEIIDDLEESGVAKISLVDSPAIAIDWMAFKQENFVKPNAGESKGDFVSRCIGVNIGEGKPQDQAAAICYSVWEQEHSKQKFAEYPWEECQADMKSRGMSQESADKLCGWIKANMQETSFNDYPQAAKNNAQRALDWAEKNGWGDCGTPVGKARANQLAKGEGISLETVARMASFARHEQNKTTPYGEGCGKLMWDAWGGDEGIAWAQRVLEQSRKENFEFDPSALPVYIDELIKKRPGLLEAKVEAAEENIEVLGYPTRHFDMCPGAIATFSHLVEMPIDDDTAGMIRAAALQADRVFEIEKQVIEANEANESQLLEAGLLVKDFMDVIHEIDEEVGMIHDVAYMQGHLETIASYLKEPMSQPLEFADVADLKVGDAVSWKTADQNPRGRIRDIVRSGEKLVPGTSFSISGSENDPGYIIEIYEKKNGKWEPTGKFAGRKADSILKNVELWRQVFATEDEQMVVGIAMIPDTEIIRKDEQGNPYYVKFSKDVIARISEKFMRELRNLETNIQHEDNHAGAYVTESWIVENAEDKINSVYGFEAPVGAWAIKMRVTDPETWKMIKAGKLNGFSIEGSFLDRQDYEAYQQDRAKYEAIKKILRSGSK